MPIFSDDFNRANSSSLGSAWVEELGSAEVYSNALTWTTSTGLIRYATQFTTDHFSEIEVRSINETSSTERTVGIAVRQDPSDNSGYQWVYNANDEQAYFQRRHSSGGYTRISSLISWATPQPFTMRLEATGANTYKGYINGTLVGTWQGTTSSVHGYIGIVGTNSSRDVLVESWRGGDLPSDLQVGGSIRPTGSMIRTFFAQFIGALSPVGSGDTRRVVLSVFESTISLFGAAERSLFRGFAGVIAGSGLHVKVPQLRKDGAVFVQSYLRKDFFRTFARDLGALLGDVLPVRLGRIFGRPGGTAILTRATGEVVIRVRLS